MLIAEVYSDSGVKSESVDEAIAILDNHPEAKAVFEKKMADVDQKIRQALSDAENDLWLVEQQIESLPDDDRPAIKELKKRILALDQMTAAEVDGGVREPKGGIIPWPEKPRPIKSHDDDNADDLDGFLADPAEQNVK